jgi:DNA-binding SARP family transcriptional activator
MSCGLADGEVDAVRFERLLKDARGREALALWRGAPLCDVAEEPFAAAEIRRLEDLRVRAGELAIDADLGAGRHHEVLGLLEALLEAEPLRERLHAQRMLALYRCGRQAEALSACREARALLVEQVTGPLEAGCAGSWRFRWPSLGRARGHRRARD